jgi:hypothetical protein
MSFFYVETTNSLMIQDLARLGWPIDASRAVIEYMKKTNAEMYGPDTPIRWDAAEVNAGYYYQPAEELDPTDYDYDENNDNNDEPYVAYGYAISIYY